MATNTLLSVSHVCTQYQVDASFVEELHAYGLVQVVEQPDGKYLPTDALTDMEKMIHLRYELGINMEGIDAVLHLLRQIAELQQALRVAEDRLKEMGGG